MKPINELVYSSKVSSCNVLLLKQKVLQVFSRHFAMPQKNNEGILGDFIVFYKPVSYHWFLSTPPENIRKSDVF